MNICLVFGGPRSQLGIIYHGHLIIHSFFFLLKRMFFFSMKTTLDSLMNNEFKSDEVVKSDGPLRKLKILSDHWTAKVVDLNSKVVAQSRQTSERSPPLAVDICVDTTEIDTRPRSRLSSPKANTSRLIPGLHHSYNAPSTTKSAHLIPVKERKSRHTYSDPQGGGFSTQRSR